MSGPLIFLGLCAVIALSIGGLVFAVRATGPVGRGRPGGSGSTDRSDPLPGWNIGGDGRATDSSADGATDGPGGAADCASGGAGGFDCDSGGGGESGGGDGGGSSD